MLLDRVRIIHCKKNHGFLNSTPRVFPYVLGDAKALGFFPSSNIDILKNH